MDGPVQRTDVPPATQTPQTPRVALGTVRVDPRSAAVGEGPGVPLIDTTGPTLSIGGQVLDLPKAYDQITPYRDGWLALSKVDGVGMVDILDASFGVIEFETRDSDLTVSPEGTRVAWAFHDGESWSIRNDDVAGEEEERPWTTLEEGPDGSEAGTIGFVSDHEVLAFQLGASLVDFEVTGARTRVVGIAEAVWEDEETLLATYIDGNQQYVVRLVLDGTGERVAGPVTDDDFTVSLRLTPGQLVRGLS